MNGTIWVRWLDSFSDNLKSKIENPKWVGILAFVVTVALGGVVASAQQPKKIPRIGILSLRGGPLPTREGALQDGLRKLGYVEGESIIIEFRFAEEKLDRLPDLVAELVRAKVDVIVAVSTPAIEAARNATKTIPIIMAGVSDPVATGFVTSLAQPGGNITGFSLQSPELSGKRLELLKEIVPQLSRVAFLVHGRDPGHR